MTVKELYALCLKQINKGNGDKTVFISQDDEGNDFHELLFGFTSGGYDIRKCLDLYRIEDIEERHKDLDNVVLLG